MNDLRVVIKECKIDSCIEFKLIKVDERLLMGMNNYPRFNVWYDDKVNQKSVPNWQSVTEKQLIRVAS